MPRYFDIRRVEYLVTKRCTGWCQHCSVMTEDRNPDHSYRDLSAVLTASSHLYATFPISSVMVYGGEPLLYLDNVVDLFRAAQESGVSRRELITNGYFTRDSRKIASSVTRLLQSGMTHAYVSVDAFHQPRIPLAQVEKFLSTILFEGFEQVFLHPSWVVRRDHDNEYNKRTESIISQLAYRHDVHVSDGNNIIPAGRFRHSLREYYPRFPELPPQRCGDIPYANAPDRVGSLRFLPNGDVHICRGVILGNVFEVELPRMLHAYEPLADPALAAIISEGARGVLDLAAEGHVMIDPEDYYGRCDLCAAALKAVRRRKLADADA